ncbi:hypothetical protein B0H16DRAFT_1482185 [Mycena metata]|uniref:Uncharacterized protein n=1 Tax=Mycena metata TaxID=1033252 RepID=A0AAD7GUQ9_9AGAR|nr:hypothetical protein B0H16DRAFT_1482185 [Mycena metata]
MAIRQQGRMGGLWYGARLMLAMLVDLLTLLSEILEVSTEDEISVQSGKHGVDVAEGSTNFTNCASHDAGTTGELVSCLQDARAGQNRAGNQRMFGPSETRHGGAHRVPMPRYSVTNHSGLGNRDSRAQGIGWCFHTGSRILNALFNTAAHPQDEHATRGLHTPTAGLRHLCNYRRLDTRGEFPLCFAGGSSRSLVGIWLDSPRRISLSTLTRPGSEVVPLSQPLNPPRSSRTCAPPSRYTDPGDKLPTRPSNNAGSPVKPDLSDLRPGHGNGASSGLAFLANV